MPLLFVHGPLKQLAGGVKEHRLQAATVLELLRELEHEHPALSGWIVDERGSIRRHINVFVNGERGREDTAVPADARVEILPAITGG
jgi:molybdopterin converting factor small subunit